MPEGDIISPQARAKILALKRKVTALEREIAELRADRERKPAERELPTEGFRIRIPTAVVDVEDPKPELGITSSNVDSLAYDSDTQVMTVGFKNGSIYEYYGVPIEKYQAVVDSPSRGRGIWTHIRGRDGTEPLYPYSKIS